MQTSIPNLTEFVVSIIGILFFAICFCLSASRPEEGKSEQPVEEMGLPRYMRKELSRTASTRQQRRYYTPGAMRMYKKPISGVAHSLSRVEEKIEGLQKVKAMRGGEFIGNRMRFKVKVLNDSTFTITDVKVFLISFPSEALRLVDDKDDESFPKIEPDGFRSPTFDFLPTQDCVRGEIIAGVSYIDERGKAHTLTTKPFVIRSVCDLLIPDQISPDEFELKLKEHECGEIVVKVQDWSPEEMFEKALRIVEDANFFEVDSNSGIQDGVFQGSISGMAKGKYTGKSVGVKILVSGATNQKGASCTIKVTGEDQAMILPAIDDLQERLSAWLCPLCGSPLTVQNVEDLKDGKVVICPFCNVSIGR